METNPECSPWQWELPNSTPAAEHLCSQLMEEARKQGFGEEDLFAIHLALEEAFVNAVHHGNQGSMQKKVFVRSSITPEKFEITIADEGPGFDPDALPDPRCPENLCKSSGRGVLLIRAYMDHVEYNQKGNQVHMIKYKGGEGPEDGPPRKPCC